jgi:hypothetical protein
MRKSLSESKTIKILLLIFILTAALSFGIIQIVASSTPTPGSNQDPIVTKSYVDAKIAEALANTTTVPGQTTTTDTSELEAMIAELGNELAALQQEYDYYSMAVSGEIEKSKYNAVQVSAGQKLLLGEGTEVILRSGSANAISGPGGDLSDLTTGMSVANGAKIEANHLIISSRDDGRGLSIISGSVWVLIKGGYSVQK